MFGGFPFGAPSFGDAPDGSSNPAYSVDVIPDYEVLCAADDVVVLVDYDDVVVLCPPDDTEGVM
jgi:hypothetical protein